MIEYFMSLPSRPEIGDFLSRQNVLCRNTVGNDGEALCCDIIFYVETECGQMERFCVTIEQFYVAT